MVEFIKENSQSICKINEDGSKCWFLNDLLHREDGPAKESVWYKAWYYHGKRHRLDGPAVEVYNVHQSWWYYGVHIKCSSQEEFERLIKLKSLW